MVAVPFLIQEAEALARRASDHHVRLGNAGFFRQPVLDIPAYDLTIEVGGTWRATPSSLSTASTHSKPPQNL